jgi:hypothetical protein
VATVLIVVAVVVSMVGSGAVFSAVQPAQAEETRDIRGDLQHQNVLGGESIDGSLRIIVTEGNLAVERYDGGSESGSWVEQYYNDDSSDTALVVDGTLYDIPGGGTTNANGIELTVADQFTTGGGSTVVTEYVVAGETGLRLVQRVSYEESQEYFDLRWEVENTGVEPVDNVKLLHGKDTYLAGGDYGIGFWNGELDTIGVRKTVSGEQQRLSLRGITEPDAYQSNYYGYVEDSLEAGELTNDVDTSDHDNGYAMEWRRSSIAGGETWAVRARESFTRASVVLTGPGTETLSGDSVDLTFEVSNVGGSSNTVDFSTDGPSGWEISAPTEVTLEAGSTSTVDVTVTPPDSASPGEYDVTLTGLTDTSTDSVTGVVEIPEGVTEPVRDDARPRFYVVERSLDRTTVPAEETAIMRTVVENRGGVGEEFHALVTGPRSILHSEEVYIGPGERRALTYPISFDEPGQRTVRLNHRFVDRLQVTAPSPDPLDDADVAVRGTSVNRSAVAPGESYDVTTTVQNTGDRTGVASVPLGTADGNTTAIRSVRNVTLDPGETREIRFEVTADANATENGTQNWSVNGDEPMNVTTVPDDRQSPTVIDRYATPSSVDPGDEYDVVGVVYNPTEEATLKAVNFAPNATDEVNLQFVRVGPGETVEVRRTVEAPTNGTESVGWRINGEPIHGGVDITG